MNGLTIYVPAPELASGWRTPCSFRRRSEAPRIAAMPTSKTRKMLSGACSLGARALQFQHTTWYTPFQRRSGSEDSCCDYTTEERKATRIVAQAKKAAEGPAPLRVAVKFGTTVGFPFRNSNASSNEALRDKLRAWQGSDADLIRRASELSGLTPEQIVQKGALAQARTLIFTRENEHSKKKNDKATHGILGSADSRLEVAYDELLKTMSKDEITPALLGRSSTPETSFRTAEGWMNRMGLLPKGYWERKAVSRQNRAATAN